MPNEVTKVTKQDIANAISSGTIADSILASFNKLSTQGQLVFPKGYSVGNQLKLMFTTISQNIDLGNVSAISVGESLAEAVIQGLEIDKKQVYFIPYGRKLQMFRSYYGDVAVAKRTGLVKDIRARVIYEGDVYDVDTNEDGESIIVGHKTTLKNMDNSIEGVYAWADLPNGKRTYCIMTWKEVQANWAKSKAGGVNATTHREFPQEMAKRTAIRRLVKMLFNTAPTDLGEESQALVGSFNRTTEDEYVKDYSQPTERKSTISNVIEEDFEEQPVEQDTDTDVIELFPEE